MLTDVTLRLVAQAVNKYGNTFVVVSVYLIEVQNVRELVGGGSAIDRATPSTFLKYVFQLLENIGIT